jgi:hypothetical protein
LGKFRTAFAARVTRPVADAAAEGHRALLLALHHFLHLHRGFS